MNPADLVNRLIEKRLRGVRQAYRGVITLVKAAGSIQLIQGEGLAGEPMQDVEMMQQYGTTSNPPVGTACIVIPLGGKTKHSVVVATEHGSYRLKSLKPGEVAVYDDEGKQVYLTRDGIVIKGAGKPIRIEDTPEVDMDTALVKMSGSLTVAGLITGQGGMAITGGAGATATIEVDLSVTGDVSTTGTLTNNGKDVGSAHAHSGVQPGPGNSGGPI